MITSKDILSVIEFDGITKKTTISDITAEELAQRKLDTAQEIARQAEADAKAAARDSALAKLAALGLTADEIAAL